ncbi:MAG: type VI secretion protein IcmF/TssM N-terminal domain-containing protein [Planctomycetota bacterium]
MAASMNSVMMKFFNLPPAMRMMLAVAGFGSLASIVYFLGGSFLRSKEGRIWILIIALIGLVLGVTIYLIIRSFRRKKSASLSGALESQGPTRGDIAEQEQIYREKFHNKMAELKANGLSVYRLPWFVLLGEPGCGKTASLIHSGLDFPLGKDEVPGFGGTRNYNWWFTNDAVILDTAGRIAFQEEGTTDRTEWEYFLKLLQKHRPRCPVNGLAVAIPADKLLRDTSEERAQKATVLRERLRQVHQVLRVRFPTFVLVTKMDLVGGFNEFFEEIRVDLQQRSQMFGWSRPGEFQEPYDPATFTQAFDDVYFRLRDWSMRYLQRKATEQELGLVVTFPESFRQIREPLNDYVSSIFQKSPLLEPPFFRGFYFTSAVQEGAPIFDVFARSRPGVTIPERAVKAVDSKAFFIHDFYERKVFAEQGLVFRSAKHVTLNRRMRRIVWAGTAAMLVLMLALFGFGYFGVADLVTKPQDDCEKAAEIVKEVRHEKVPIGKWKEHIPMAQKLREHYDSYNKAGAPLRAHSLYIFANIHVPRDRVGLIHARYTLDTLLSPILRETEQKLLSDPVNKAPDEYLAALRVYTRWYGEIVGSGERELLDEDQARERGGEVRALLNFVGGGTEDERAAALEEIVAALESLADENRYFALQVLNDQKRMDKEEATNLLVAVVEKLKDYQANALRLDNEDDKFLAYWLGLADKLRLLRERYGELLTLETDLRQLDTLNDASRRFRELAADARYLGETDSPTSGSIAEAYFELQQYLVNNPVPRIDKKIMRLGDQARLAAEQWNQGFASILEPLEEKAPNRLAPQNAVYARIDEARDQLEIIFEELQAELRQRLNVPPQAEPAVYYAETEKLIELDELTDKSPRFDRDPSIKLIDKPFGPKDQLKGYLSELASLLPEGDDQVDLSILRNWLELLKQSQSGTLAGPTLEAWLNNLSGLADTSPTDIKQYSGLNDRPFWRPLELLTLVNAVQDGLQLRTRGGLFNLMKAECQRVSEAPDLPGLAQLMPGYNQIDDSLPFEPLQTEVAEETPPTEEVAPVEAEPPPDDGVIGGRRRRAAPPPPEESATPEPRRRGPRQTVRPPLVKYHTLQFLHQTLMAHYEVSQALAKHGEPGKAVIKKLDLAADAYIRNYFLDWKGVYDNYLILLDKDTRAFLEQCRGGASDWSQFRQGLLDSRTQTTGGLSVRTESLVRECLLFEKIFTSDQGPNDAAYNRIADVRAALGPNQDLPTILKDITKEGLASGDRDPARAISTAFSDSWNKYLDQVERMGADPNATSYPSQQSLREGFASGIAWQSKLPRDFRLIAPLLDIAEYGEHLLRHHLDRKLVALFASHGRGYPVAGSVSDSAPMDPRDFLKLLWDVRDFNLKYGALYESLNTDVTNEYRQALLKCDKWAKFLYNKDLQSLDMSTQPPEPPPMPIVWWIADNLEKNSPASKYFRIETSLPVLSPDTLAPIAPVTNNARSASDNSIPQNSAASLSQPPEPHRHFWSLFPKGSGNYPPPRVRVFEKVQGASGKQELAATWNLPQSPWSLMLLVGVDERYKRGAKQWIIPVDLERSEDGKQIGFYIAIQFERELPLPISPLTAPGTPGGMNSANEYLTGP